ncbi:MAG: hypothetical protein C5B50_01585 [Verrucomicrobia bacterium]|nr:MAG: hypothetical protein C5B50_01585 [Verrucomicrobiota bacterium]
MLGGQNVLTVYVTNIFEIAMGLNASVSLTGSGIIPAGSPCCPIGSGLSGRKFFDMNCNGVQDPGEPGLAGWTIQMSGGATTQSAVTDVNGYYYFTNLVPGTYTVTEVPQSGWTQSAPPGGSYTVSLGNLQQINGLNFGNCHASSNCVHILCPSNIVTECTGYGGAFVDFNVSASSSCTTNPVHITCYPPPKHFFTIGTTTVNCTAYDAQYNWTNCSFTVTVVDDLPPTITCPSNIVVTSCTNIQEFYSASASDLCCGTNVHITYNPPSGSYFAPGTVTTVICTATDCNSNSATCSFTVTVNPIPASFQNGDFSTAVPSNGTGGGWTTSDLIGPPTGWQATGGNPGACFLLNEVGSQGQNPTISQTICCLSTGQCYKIRWQTKIQAYLSNPQGLPSFGVFVDGNLIYSYDGDSDDTSWHQYSASFVATNSCQTISFEAELDPTDVSYYLDNVTIAPCCTNTCSFVCAPDKTVYCPTNWTFDRPTLGTQSCCSNVVFTLVSSNTLVSNPCRSVYEGVWQGMDCCSNLMVCTQFVTAVKSGPPVLNPGIMLDYSTLPDAGINFAGGGFTFVGNASGFQFQIDDVSNGAGDSLGFNGYFTSSSAFSIGTITINGAMQSAPVTGSCVIHISDGVNELTGTVQWVDIATLGTSGVLNLNGVVNLTGIAYGGSSLDLQSLVASASGSIDMTFQFVPARTLTQLKNTGGFSDFSGSILGSPFLAPTAAVNCPTNKTVPCGTAWTFDLPQAAGSCCTNLTITVINTLTNKLTVPCATEYTRTWKITDCCTNTAICMQTVTVLHCVPPPAGMVAWWPGDGNTLDIAGGNNGTLQGNAGYGPGEVGQAFTFDGNNSWVQVPPSSTSTLNITGPVTIDAWVRFNSVNPNPGNGWPVVWKGNSSGYDPTSAYGLGVTGSNQLWGLVGNFSVSSEVYGPFLTQLGTWYHIALVADGTNLTLYANGAAVSSAPQTVSPYASPYPLVIGGIYNSPPNNWNGSIDEVEIFNRALSASQINTIYQAGAAGKCKTPELTCASPKTVVCGQSWSFNPPVVNDPCCGTNLAATPISTVTNGPCPITVTRTWLYMDCCGNSNLCSQVVTVINTNPPTITCSSNKTVECGSAWMFDPPTAFAPCCSNVVANSTNVGGSIFLTGHDPDFHAYIGGNKVGAQDINKRAIAFIMDPAFNPYWNKKFLFVEASITPPSGHTDGVNGIIASGYVQGTDFDRVDASGLNAALNQLGTTYGGIVVASDFGGILTQAELDILNARANDIANFVNSGGGLYAISESDNGAHLTPNGGWYKFVPVVTISTSFNQTETGNSVTAFGASLGLVNSDVNGNYSHAIFTSAAGLNAVDLDASGDMLSVAGRKVLLPPPNVTITVISTVTNFAGHCGKTFDATRTWMATDCCSNIATCSQKVTVVDTTPPIIGCSSNKTVNCGTAWSFDVPSVFAPCCSNSQVYVVGNGNGGRIYLTGHDPDFHANSGNTGNNFTGAQHINQAAISYIMNNPYVNVYGLHKFLFVESSITPPSGHIDGVIGIIDSGYAVNVDFDRADATTLNAKLNLLGSTYAGIVVASDYGGILTQAELDILNSRAADIANFVNSGGGLYAMAEADGGAGLTPNGGWYNFVPIVTTSAALNQPETGNTVTPFGASLGLVNSDINGNASHAIFLSAGGLNTVDLDPSSHILSVAGQNVVIPPPNNSLIVQLISSNLISGPCPQVWQGVWRAQDCCSNSITCTQLVTVLPSAPTLLCSNLTINCGSPIPTNRPAYIDPCCTNVVVSLVSSTTAGSLGASNSCTEIISQTWRAVDLCCNMTNTCVRTITVLGVPPPVITCPTNITIVTCSNNVIVTWSITATDLCSSVTAVSTPPSGSSFQLGTTNTVTVVATNICGTAATCTFPVILIAPGATISIKPGPGIGQVTITWLDGGILQQSNGLVQQSNGTWTFQPWVNVAGAMSPYTVPASSLQRYYRVLCP